MTQDAARVTKVDLTVRVETTIDHPVDKVWPYLLRWNLWVDAKQFVPHRVAGKPGSEGEIRGVSHLDETGRMDSLFFLKIIKIIPNKQVVIKCLSPQYSYDAVTGESAEVAETGYEVFNVYEKDGHTVMSLDGFFERSVVGVTEDEVRNIVEQYRVYTENNWYKRYFPNLKKLLAQA